MIIERRNPRTGVVHTRDLPITQDQYDRWKAGELIQRAMPRLTPEEREWIKTGFFPEDWEEIFPPEMR